MNLRTKKGNGMSQLPTIIIFYFFLKQKYKRRRVKAGIERTVSVVFCFFVNLQICLQPQISLSKKIQTIFLCLNILVGRKNFRANWIYPPLYPFFFFLLFLVPCQFLKLLADNCQLYLTILTRLQDIAIKEYCFLLSYDLF